MWSIVRALPQHMCQHIIVPDQQNVSATGSGIGTGSVIALELALLDKAQQRPQSQNFCRSQSNPKGEDIGILVV